MKVLNFGSLNVDYVYMVDEFLLPGETKPALERNIIPGGKGLNQSVALARAGAEVYHAGIIGNDGGILLEALTKNNVRTDFLLSDSDVGGHTIIQVDKKGQNKIILFGGTNKKYTKAFIDKTLTGFASGDIVLVQNETNLVDYIIVKASEKGIKTVFNAAPISREVLDYPLGLVDWLIVNEGEGAVLAGTEKPDEILKNLSERYKKTTIFLTLGPEGCCCSSQEGTFSMEAIPVSNIVDTTAAGDTYIGYLIKAHIDGLQIREAMVKASVASSLSIQKLGASTSVPSSSEVEKAFREWTSR